MLVSGCFALAWGVEAILESEVSAFVLLSAALWRMIVTALGGQIVDDATAGARFAEIPFTSLLAVISVLAAMSLGLAAIVAKRRRNNIPETLRRWLWTGWRWWFLPAAWSLLGLLLFVMGWETASSAVAINVQWVAVLTVAGWLAEFRFCASHAAPKPIEPAAESWSVSRQAIAAMLVYAIVFTILNWQLYRGLLVPHGDSAMYEEHLWNLTHGKGFRSYLDQGLFLGEHIQVVHLLLLPLYVVWPSHLLLELCQSVALASGAIPVYWMACRACGSQRGARLLAIAYLCYPPMQFLDIAVDFKTFRPEAFVIPAVLFGLDQYERGRLKGMLVCFAIGLSAKEDYTLILAPLGLWIALRHAFSQTATGVESGVASLANRRRDLVVGLGIAVFSVAYLLLATRIVMPWFRGGEELHYVQYYSQFGNSFGEVVINMLTRPGLVLSQLFSITSLVYLSGIFGPLAFLPCFSPSRIAVAAPVLGLLCLNQIVHSDPYPHHHFQAPVVPLVFWAAAGALRPPEVTASVRCFVLWNRLRDRVLRRSPDTPSRFGAAFACLASLMATVVVGQSPLSVRFWDPGSLAYWRNMYVPGPRAEHFQAVFDAIPQSARVASTDFVHPRFTHHERSYDYSHYRRRVAGYEDRVPDDTDYIVIDTQHRYSEIKSPAQMRELQREPAQWELLDLPIDGYFIVLRRRL